MKAEVKKIWIDALLSRNYVQGRGCLRYRDEVDTTVLRYCCLGVLGDLHPEKRWIDHSLYVGDDSDEGTSYLPWDMGQWAGLHKVEQDYLARLNDEGLDFKGIAEYIENNL